MMHVVWYLVNGLLVNVVVKITLMIIFILLDAKTDGKTFERLEEIYEYVEKLPKWVLAVFGIPFVSDIVFWPMLPICGIVLVNYVRKDD